MGGSIICSCVIFAVFRQITLNKQHTHPIVVKYYIEIVYATILSFLNILYLSNILELECWKVCQILPIGFHIYSVLIFFQNEELRFNGDDLELVYHCVYTIAVSFLFDRFPYEFSVFYLTEINHIGTCICNILDRARQRSEYPKLYNYSKLFFLMSFIIVRLLIFFNVSLYYFLNEKDFVSTAFLLLWVVNCIRFTQI